MPFLLIFILQVFVLFLLSKSLLRKLSKLFYKITHSKKLTVYLLAILFLPGTAVHELSHWAVATALFVPTGKITLWPEIEEDGIKMGSVQIAKVDILRRLLVGIAPFVVGTAVLLVLLLYIASGAGDNLVIIAISVYVMFTVGNTMFSSKKDLQGAWLVVLASVILAILLRPNIDISPQLAEQISRANFFMLVPIVIDLLLVVALQILIH